MRGKKAEPRKTPFAQWLYDARTSRGLTMAALAERAGISHARISQLEKGDDATRDIVERIVEGLIPPDLDHGSVISTRTHLLKAGLSAAGFRTVDDATDYDNMSSSDYPPEFQEALAKAKNLSPQTQSYLYQVYIRTVNLAVDIDAMQENAWDKLQALKAERASEEE